MRPNRIGRKVRITGGISEFVGATGTITSDAEWPYLRVALDEPVEIDSVVVTDDLWLSHLLRTLRR